MILRTMNSRVKEHIEYSFYWVAKLREKNWIFNFEYNKNYEAKNFILKHAEVFSQLLTQQYLILMFSFTVFTTLYRLNVVRMCSTTYTCNVLHNSRIYCPNLCIEEIHWPELPLAIYSLRWAQYWRLCRNYRKPIQNKIQPA